MRASMSVHEAAQHNVALVMTIASAQQQRSMEQRIAHHASSASLQITQQLADTESLDVTVALPLTASSRSVVVATTAGVALAFELDQQSSQRV